MGLNDKFNDWLDEIAKGKKLEEFLMDNARECHQNIVAWAPKDTGRYASSIQLGSIERKGKDISVEIFTDLDSGWNGVKLAEFLENGTGIYREDGTGRQTPWVYWSEKLNRFVFTKGQVAKPHWTPAYEMQIIKMEEGLKHVFD